MALESQRPVADKKRQKYIWGKLKTAQRTLGLCCFTCILRDRLPAPAVSTGQAGPEELQKEQYKMPEEWKWPKEEEAAMTLLRDGKNTGGAGWREEATCTPCRDKAVCLSAPGSRGVRAPGRQQQGQRHPA